MKYFEYKYDHRLSILKDYQPYCEVIITMLHPIVFQQCCMEAKVIWLGLEHLKWTQQGIDIIIASPKHCSNVPSTFVEIRKKIANVCVFVLFW